MGGIGINFGNLNVRQLVERCKIKSITEEEIKELEEYRCNSATVEDNKFHIFDLPHNIVAHGKAFEIALKVLSKYSDEFDITYNLYERA